MSIVDETGTPVATYEYDPYGNVISATGTLAEVNPIRYRGYVYDSESGFYYLQSRYYDPEIGRFLNADAFISTGQGILGNNMFAYCNNNAVNLYDPSGTIPFYDDPLQQAIEEVCKWYWETDEKETDGSGNLTLAAKIKQTINSFMRNLEIYAGLGVGLGEIIKILDIGFSLCAKYDILAVRYSDGEWKFGQDIAMSLSTSATQALEVGGGLDIFIDHKGISDPVTWILYNDKKESWTLVAGSSYAYFVGGSVEIGFDLNTFLYEITAIWE